MTTPADTGLDCLRQAPLSYAQEGLWLHSQLGPGSGFYNNVLVVRMQGRLDVAALQRSLGAIVGRHETLRTTFPMIDGQPVQWIARSYRLPLPVADGTGPAVEDGLDAALRHAAEIGAAPFDLAARPLIRAGLIRIASDDHLLVVAMHHLVSDGGSITILMGELVALYSADVQGGASPLPELPLQHADFVERQRGRVSEARRAEGIAFWRRQLEGIPTLLALPTDRPRPRNLSHRGGLHHLRLPPELTPALQGLAHRHGVTLYMLLLAGLQVLLRRYTGQRDVVVGTPMTHRIRPELRGMIAYLANTLAMRTSFTDDCTFGELLRRVGATATAAYAHSYVPFEQVVQALRPARAAGHHPVFQVVLSLHETLSGDLDQSRFAIPGLQLSFPPHLDIGTSRFDLTLCVHQAPDRIGIDVEYSADLFERATVERLAGHLERLLTGAARTPDTPISALPLLTEPELRIATGDGPDAAAPATSTPAAWLASNTSPLGGSGRVVVAGDLPDGWLAQLEVASTARGRGLLQAGDDWPAAVRGQQDVVVGIADSVLAGRDVKPWEGTRPRAVVLVGEPPLVAPWRRWLQRGGPPVAVLYTAAGCAACCWLHQAPGGARPLGHGVAGRRLYVLDEQLQPVPPGVAGRLHVGGPHVGGPPHGDQTGGWAPDPFVEAPNARMLATDDLARSRPDGTVELLGSVSAPCQVEGVPVAPCLLEALLGEHPSVRDALVVSGAASSHQDRLVAWVVPEPGTTLSDVELRRYLRERLPPHLVPEEVGLARRLPRRPDGRLDRHAMRP